MKVIAVSGVARSGKDTFANSLQQVIIENNPSLRVARESFASFLKDEMRDFIFEKFDKNIYELDGEEKEMLRPLMVAYGFAKRTQTKGRYFVDLLTKRMQNSDSDVFIISDLRYAEKESDELFWLQKEVKGLLVHVSRFEVKNGKKSFIKAPNLDEKTNDPILKSNANFCVAWETAQTQDELNSISKSYCEDFYYKNISFFL